MRGCALDSGTLTTDTEIVRMSHCGGFYYDKRYLWVLYEDMFIYNSKLMYKNVPNFIKLGKFFSGCRIKR